MTQASTFPLVISPGRFARACCVGVLVLLLGSCTQINVRPADGPALLEDWQESAGSGSDLSPRTLQSLRTLDLEQVYRADAGLALVRLHALAVQDPQPDLLFALAELSYRLGGQWEKGNGPRASAYYYLCAGYAYHYLFGAESSPFDPRFRLACDLYNTALSHCLRAAQRERHLDPGQQLQLVTPDGKDAALSVKHVGFPWNADEFGPLLFCADFHVVGLDKLHRTYGLGVPLICTRRGSTAAPGRAFYPTGVSFPVTAFFRFEGSLADLGACHAGRLELYNPLAVQSIAVRGRPVTLETDLTTPVAYFLSHSGFQKAISGFLDADKLQGRAGIYLTEPYQPGKIPVLFVHGLLSDPLTWATMFNDLRADPELRRRYQFWFYFYPTGVPYLQTAAELREDLADLRTALDPAHHDPALDNIICVGHSMGGLISRLQTVASGDAFWRLVSREPLDALKLQPQTRDELRRAFLFEPEPSVRRVIFLATPHHGSALSGLPAARLVDAFVRLPQDLLQTTQDLMRQEPGSGLQTLPTSVDLLALGSPALEVLANCPVAQGVHYHSIIGQAPGASALREITSFLGEGKERGDGIVPYASAHLDGVDSELVVVADHVHIQHHPLAVLEVRRILLEHARGGPD
jgi:pimeloyl-ACP methyl ester carboxylesterase